MNLDELKFCDAHPYLTFRGISILIILYQNGERMLFHNIASRLNVPKPSISRAFDGLSKMKLIERKRNEEDCRTVYAVLTAAGKSFVERINAC